MAREVNNYFYNSVTTRKPNNNATSDSMLIEKLILFEKVSKLYHEYGIILYYANKWLTKMYILMIHTNRLRLETKISVKTGDY